MWLDQLQKLATTDGAVLYGSTLKKIKKSGVWLRQSPQEYYAAGKARYEEMMEVEKLKEGARP